MIIKYCLVRKLMSFGEMPKESFHIMPKIPVATLPRYLGVDVAISGTFDHATSQGALVRKQLLFVFDDHWSTLVRLGAWDIFLRPNHSGLNFAERCALLQVHTGGASLPADFSNWKDDRCRKVGLLQDPSCGHGAV